jgi:hypothetical protein
MTHPPAPQASPATAPSADSADSPPSLPPVPRPLTPRARRRSWAELPVRVWIILLVAIAIVTLVFSITRINEALNDRYLFEHGVDVVAKFTSVNGDPFPKRRFRNEPMPAVAVFDWHGAPYTLQIPRLEAKPDTPAMVGEDFHIKVDPKNPERWTEETEPKPWSQELTVIGFLLPVLLAIAAVALLKRRRVLRTWRDGTLAQATVVETHQSGAAPLSRVVRFTLVGAGSSKQMSGDAVCYEGQPNRRIFSTLIPAAAGIPKKGDTLWLLHLPSRPSQSIVASLYASDER